MLNIFTWGREYYANFLNGIVGFIFFMRLGDICGKPTAAHSLDNKAAHEYTVGANTGAGSHAWRRINDMGHIGK